MTKTMVRTNNQIILIGRATRVKEFGKDVASITVALDNGRNKDGEEIKDTFVDVKCFEPKVYTKVKPGMLVMVSAHFNNNSYEKEGKKIYSTDVVANAIEFLESKATVEAREAEKAATETTEESTEA